MTDYQYVDTPAMLTALVSGFRDSGTVSLAMDFEEESNLHVYGEHLCLIQLSDGSNFYVIDALALSKSEEGRLALKDLLEGPEEKIMFDCSSDAAIVRKALKIQLRNIYDLRLAAKALGFMGNLSSLIERNLGISPENPADKKKFQKANWMKRPLSGEQLAYALDDVRYLFELKASLEKEMAQKLSPAVRKQLASNMKNCARPRHRDKPGWEKICNYHALSQEEKIYIRCFFNARDSIARERNVPPGNILDKHKIVQMAHAGTWEGILDGDSLQYRKNFERARLEAQGYITRVNN